MQGPPRHPTIWLTLTRLGRCASAQMSMRMITRLTEHWHTDANEWHCVHPGASHVAERRAGRHARVRKAQLRGHTQVTHAHRLRVQFCSGLDQSIAGGTARTSSEVKNTERLYQHPGKHPASNTPAGSTHAHAQCWAAKPSSNVVGEAHAAAGADFSAFRRWR